MLAEGMGSKPGVHDKRNLVFCFYFCFFVFLFFRLPMKSQPDGQRR